MVKSASRSPEQLVRNGLVFLMLSAFSFFGLFAVSLGYDFFHKANPNGVQGIFFLICGGGTLFFGFQLIKAFTDPLPAWYIYFCPTPIREPETDRPKKQSFMALGITYVVIMTISVPAIMGPRLGFSPERTALLFSIGLLIFLLLFVLLDLIRAIYLFRRDTTAPSGTPTLGGSE